MTSLGLIALLILGVIVGIALIAMAYHAGYFIRDIRDRLQSLTKRVDAIEHEQADDTPAIVEARTPKEVKEHKFDPEDEESAIVEALTPREIADAKRRKLAKEIEEAE